MTPDPNILGPATFVVGQGINAFMQFMPKLQDCRRTNPDENPAFAADVRIGEGAAVATTIGLGLIASSFSHSPAPTYVAIVTSVALVVLFEATLRSERPFEPKIRRAVNLAEMSN